MSRHLRRRRRLRWAAIAVSAGLLTEAVSLGWAHPASFLAFALGAGGLIGGGVVLFLTTLFATGPEGT